MSSSPKRKLTAILFTDMAGFTDLMRRDEALALRLRDRHRQVLREAHDRYNGEIIQYFGDGTLSLFDSVVEAVQCAVALQEVLQQDPKVPLRIGIHTGDVVVDEEGVFGDGVNIASRIESFAVPGSVLISEQVRQYILNQPDLPVKSLGTFNLKNVDQPVMLYAVTASGLEVPKPDHLAGKGHMEAPTLANLPAQLTNFIGRDREVAEVKALLKNHRIVTLTGPGGTGKTRLSLQVGEKLRVAFEDGVCFVPLASVRETAVVPSVIAQRLGVHENPMRDVLDSLVEFLKTKELLLILDNFEQIVEAAPAIQRLLVQCSRIKILITSRIILHIQGEQEYAVPPLALPDLRRMVDVELLKQYPSVRLFSDRAKAARSDFEITQENGFEIADICRRLDGLPLAIELAASRIKLFSPKVMLERLDKRLDLLKSRNRDRPERHQALRQTIAWSYELLSEEEQAFCRRLAVFAGGFSASQAEAVCFLETEKTIDIYDLIADLLDKSLLRKAGEALGESRFVQLETIREYGLEQLEQLGELQRFQQKHAAYFLRVAEEVEPHLTDHDQKEWLDRLEVDHDNFRVALYWAEQQNEAETGLRMAGALWRFWGVRSHMVEGRQRLERLLRLPAEGVNPSVRAKALNAIGTLLNMIAVIRKAIPYLEESLALARESRDEREIAAALNHLAWSAAQLLDYEAMEKYFEEALHLHKKLKQDRGISVAHTNMGFATLIKGDLAVALEHLEKALAIRKKIEDQRGEGYLLSIISWAYNNIGDYPNAESHARKALEILRPIQDEQLMAFALTNLGYNHLVQRNIRQAQQLLQEGDRLWDVVGNNWGQGHSNCYLANCFIAQSQWNRAAECIEKANHHWIINKSPFGQGWLLYLNGLLAHGKGEPEKARAHLIDSIKFRRSHSIKLGVLESIEALLIIAGSFLSNTFASQLIGFVIAERERIGASIHPLNRRRYESALEHYRSVLGENIFQENVEKGKAADSGALLDRLVS